VLPTIGKLRMDNDKIKEAFKVAEDAFRQYVIDNNLIDLNVYTAKLCMNLSLTCRS
jgi:hypothetical protein